MSNRNFVAWWLVVGTLGALVAMPASPSHATEAEPQNIVVFLADDLKWADLPFFSEPPVWQAGSENRQDQPLPSPPDIPAKGTAEMNAINEANYRRPDLNRFAARAYANPDGSLGRVRSGEPLVVPIDLDLNTPANEDGTAAAFRYNVDNPACRDTSINPASNPDCPPSRDVLRGFGGLGRLAREGVIMPRFYSNSARCAPSRVAFLTGRHQQRAGVTDNGNSLNADQNVTFGELLKQGCAEGDPRTCYHTGFFGKWNPTDDSNVAWKQGFDEFVGFESAARPYFSKGKAACSHLLDHESDPANPKPAKFCLANPRDYPCTTNADCPSGVEPSCAPYEYDCKPMICSEYGICYNPNPTHACEVDADCCPGGACGSSCVAVPRYIGRKNQTACEPRRGKYSPDCCAISSRTNLERRQQFGFQNRRRIIDGDTVFMRFDKKEACNNDGPYTLDDIDLNPLEPGGYKICMYSDRLVRDFARNFLIRRLYDDPADRFLLVVAPKAAHVDIAAPSRTEAHYDTIRALRPDRPDSDGPGYWAVVEELDALVGTILNLIDGMCDASSGEEMAGTPCEPGDTAACGNHPERCLSHRDDTLVLFSNDNGSPAVGWGQPELRGAKLSTLEGGTRVGLIARGPGLGIGTPTGESGTRANATSASIGNLVDIFSTIAEAAGYDLDAADEGHASVSTCDGTDDFCSSNTDCAGECKPYFIDGRSLVSVLNGAGEDESVVTPGESMRRDYVYTNYGAAGEPSNAVTTRDGYFPPCDANEDGVVSTAEASACSAATHVCSYERSFVAPGAVAQLTRQHRASSCIVCDPTATNPCAAERCEVVGKFCTTKLDDDQDDCADWSGGGGDEDLCGLLSTGQRCRSEKDCPPNQLCYGNIAINCSTCTAATWKARAGDSSSSVAELFDLSSNTEEDPKQSRYDTNLAVYGADGRLNCAVHNVGQQWQLDRLQATASALGSRISEWQTCVKSSAASGQECEPN